MSVKLMSIVWEIEKLDPYERLVLLSLADHAGDDGTCYPSVSRLCRRTGMKERGVQNVLRRLVGKGVVRVARNEGRNGANLYTLTPAPGAPRTECAPAPDYTPPPHSITSTPAPGAPKPSRTVSETSVPPKSPVAILSQIVSSEVAEDFFQHRKQIKAAMTERAAQQIVKRLQSHPDPAAVLCLSIENGWRGVFPEKVKQEKRNGSDIAKRVAARVGGMDSRESSGPVVPLLQAGRTHGR